MWLRSDQLHDEVGGDGGVVLVSHADFIALLLAALHGDSAGGYGDSAAAGEAADAGRSSDNEVSYHSCTERQLVIAGQVAGQEEYARSVYARYKLSLACTCLLDMARNGTVKVVSMNDKRHLKDKAGRCSIH